MQEIIPNQRLPTLLRLSLGKLVDIETWDNAVTIL